MIAMVATIAVVYPDMNGIGGDSFWLVREPSARISALMAAGRAGENALVALSTRPAGQEDWSRRPAPMTSAP
jgi:gamma-glutamyltranspeptidase